MVTVVLFLAVDVGVGIALLVLIATLATRTGPRRGESARALGWLLVGVPLPAAVCLHLAGVLAYNVDQVIFLGSVVAFAIGAALLLGDDTDDWREPSDDGPPWWPEFEREFRRYARRSRPTPRPTALV
jgi:hypothetical protein